MPRFLSWSPLVAAIAMILASSTSPVGTVAAQSEPTDAAARAEFEAGRDAYDRGRFKEALEHYDRAYALSSNPKMLFNIGRAAEADLQHERAVQAYEAYLQALERAENREFVEARLAKLREIARRERTRPSAPTRTPALPPVAAPATYDAAPAANYVAPAAKTSLRSTRPPVRLYAGLRVGVGGSVSFDPGEGEADLASTFGLQTGAGYVWRYFGIGGELGWSRFSGDVDDAQGSQAIDVVAKPRGGYQFPNLPLEVYGSLPIGLSFLTGDIATYFETEVGFSVGFVAGATYFFTPNFGVNAELGWNTHSYSMQYPDAGTITFGQFSPLIVNAMLAL